MNTRRELEILAAFVHGILMFGHLLAILFHCRKKHWNHACVHALAAFYDLCSIIMHYREAGREEANDRRTSRDH